MKKSHKNKHRIFIFLASFFVSLILAEVIVGKFLPQKTYTKTYKGANDCFQKSMFTVFTLKPNCTMRFDDYDTGEKFEMKINSLGYRGEEFETAKKPGERRILVEGDSFILGFGVKDRDLITTHLANKLNDSQVENPLKNAKVINAGYAGGFGPDGYFLHLKNYGARLEPDLVVFSIFVFNDFSDMADSEWSGTGKFGEPTKVTSKTTQVDEFGHLIPASIPFIYRLPVFRESNLAILSAGVYKNLDDFGKYIIDRVKFKIFPPTFPTADAKDSNLAGEYISTCLFGETCHRNTMHLYSDLISVIKASNNLVSRFVVLIIPAEFQIYPDTMEKYKTDLGIQANIVSMDDPNPQKRIKELLAKEDIPYIDLLPVMRKSRERLYFQTDGHWNAKGHEAAAEEVYRWILANYK